MISRKILLLGIAFLALPRAVLAAEEKAQDPAPAVETAPAQDPTIERYRTPFEVLSERMIGAASRAVRFDWRKKNVGFGFVASEILELNNFSSARVGGSVRRPVGSFMGEVAVTRVFTSGSASTEKLALTPYRQVGRPGRFELDVNFAYPLAEGVATARPGFFPATELVFCADVGLRYVYYPGQFSGEGFTDVAKALVTPRLSSKESDNLEGDRLPGMQIDRGRYNILSGLSLDIYFQSGGFLLPRVLFALPITGADLGLWWELTFSAGWMF